MDDQLTFWGDDGFRGGGESHHANPFPAVEFNFPAAIDAWLDMAREQGGLPKSPHLQVIALVEEAGEFAGAYRRWTGAARRSGTFADVADELADVVICANTTARRLGIDLDAAVESKLARMMIRGAKDKPSTD